MKKKIATVWLGGCSGCHMSLLDIDERLLDVARLADIVKSPIVDGKKIDEVDVVIIEGALAIEEHMEEIQHLRKIAKVLVALGDCAAGGNVTALRNPFSKKEVLEHSYINVASNEHGKVPSDPEVSALLDRVVPLHEVVKVDHYVPGCPPNADLIFHVIFELLNGRDPKVEEMQVKLG